MENVSIISCFFLREFFSQAYRKEETILLVIDFDSERKIIVLRTYRDE